MEIKDITSRFNRPAKFRPESRIDTIIVHHDAGRRVAENRVVPLLDQYHQHHFHEGLGGLGYHYVISAAGTIYKCNPVTRQTNHARGGNATGIGICVQGFFHKPYNEHPTKQQLTSLRALIKELRKVYKYIQYVIPHRWVRGSKTACPGDVFMADWKEWDSTP